MQSIEPGGTAARKGGSFISSRGVEPTGSKQGKGMEMRRIMQLPRRAGLVLAGVALLGVLASGALSRGVSAQAGELRPERPGPREPVISVTGQAEVLTPPDEATVRLGVTRQAANARAAQDQANDIGQRLLAGLERLGVPRGAVRTSQLSLQPIFEQQRPGDENPPRIVAYRAAMTISVRLEKLDLVGPVVDAGLQAGANRVEGVQFGLRDSTAAQQEALRRAVREARGKAQALAEGLGLRVDRVLEVSEGGGFIPRAGEESFALAARAPTPTPVAPGEVSVSAMVTVRFRIAEMGALSAR
jgi:uncharacterized protein YggE